MMSIDEIKSKLAFAAKVLRALPGEHVQGFISSWPASLSELDILQETDISRNQYHPTPAEISEMDKILEWLKPLNAFETKLVWRRANHVPWKLISEDLGYHRSKLDEKYRIALVKIQAIAV